jgi:pyruvate kinase
MSDTNNSEPAPNRTKILATIDTASQTPEALRKLSQSGVDSFRLIFSHARHEEHSAVLADIRAVSCKMGRDGAGGNLKLFALQEGLHYV